MWGFILSSAANHFFGVLYIVTRRASNRPDKKCPPLGYRVMGILCYSLHGRGNVVYFGKLYLQERKVEKAKTNKLFLIIGTIMFISALCFVVFAFNHPQGSFPWSNSTTYTIYFIYAGMTIFFLVKGFKK